MKKALSSNVSSLFSFLQATVIPIPKEKDIALNTPAVTFIS
jgi:hypothetical protein